MSAITDPQIKAFRLLTIMRGMETELACPGLKVSRINVFEVARQTLRDAGKHAPRLKKDVMLHFVYHLKDLGLVTIERGAD